MRCVLLGANGIVAMQTRSTRIVTRPTNTILRRARCGAGDCCRQARGSVRIRVKRRQEISLIRLKKRFLLVSLGSLGWEHV
jgi:hypothetical protein